MPGDPEIDRDVKSGEEKLWEAVYDNKTDKVEHILNTYLTGRLSPPDGPGIDLNWKCTPRRGVFGLRSLGARERNAGGSLHVRSSRQGAAPKGSLRMAGAPRREGDRDAEERPQRHVHQL